MVFGDRLGPIQQITQGVEEGSAAPRLEAARREGPYIGDRPAVHQRLLGVVAVELDDRHDRVAGLGPLLGEEGVEPADHVIGDRGHRPRTVQQEPDVGPVLLG